MVKSGLLAAALLALPCGAVAGTAGTVAVGRAGVAGTLRAAGAPQTWGVHLDEGLDYAAAAWFTGGGGHEADLSAGTLEVDAAGGRRLCGDDQPSTIHVGGCEFRAPYTGLYSVSLTGVPGGPYPADYDLWVSRDCRADARTECRITAGHTHPALLLDYATDTDWIAAKLLAGRKYTITARDQFGYGWIELFLHDPKGVVVATNYDEPATISFVAGVTGTYFIQVDNDSDQENRYDYSLSLSRPSAP